MLNKSRNSEAKFTSELFKSRTFLDWLSMISGTFKLSTVGVGTTAKDFFFKTKQ